MKKPLPQDTTAMGTLADLLRQRGVTVGETSAPAAPAAAAPADAALDLGRVGTLVVRRERKGHGGKTVTVIDGLAALPPPRLEALARDPAQGARLRLLGRRRAHRAAGRSPRRRPRLARPPGRAPRGARQLTGPQGAQG
jgi:hypothetical protein